jgi:hypothetical protein
MGKRGPKPQRPDGQHVTRKGYLRGKDPADHTKLKLGHVRAWESVNGPVPDGYQIHHIDGDKTNNALDNLLLVDPVSHKRIHSGCKLVDGVWWKPCRVCGLLRPVTEEWWYFSREGWPLYGRCRPCHISKVVESKRLRRLRKAASSGLIPSDGQTD